MLSKSTLVAAVMVVVTSGAVGLALHAHASPSERYGTCYDAQADGRHAVPASDPGYRKIMDFDGDGYACEQVEKKEARSVSEE